MGAQAESVQTLEFHKPMTVEEYLAFEDKAAQKHEYRNGKIIPMAGGSPNHGITASQAASAIKAALKAIRKSNSVINSDVRIWIDSVGRYVYSDGAVMDIPIQYFPHKSSGVINPILIIEVTSDSTEADDRGEKFAKYKTLPSFREYVLISQKEPKIEVFYRQAPGSDWWQIKTYEGMDATIFLQSLGCEIKLADVYEGIDFSAEEAPGEA